MRISTILLIVVLILVLYYYTAETFEVVEVVGKVVYQVVKEGVFKFKEHQPSPTPEKTLGNRIIESISEKLGN
jgi:hypothetical protein